jgi:hypothetical protein
MDAGLLGSQWVEGRGGFGYADTSGETAACNTLFPDMRNAYSTVYVRRSFEVTDVPVADQVLRMTMDYDDGFIAWLDGVYIAGRNTPTGSAEPAYTQTAPSNHESSRGSGSNPPETFTIGAAADWLPSGVHTLAIMGLNTSLSSSDFILIPDLFVEDASSGSTNVVSGVLTTDTTWSVENSPYHAIGEVTVAAGATLTVEPGVVVEFDTGVGLTIEGRLVAEGTESDRIGFRRAIGAGGWGRISISGGVQESRIAYATIDGAAGRGNVKGVDAMIHLDHVVFTNTITQLVTVDDTSIDIRNCVFPTISNDELLHFSGMPANGYARLHNNRFGTTSGYNDTIDFTGGNRPGPIAEFIGNVFESAVDDCFDMDGTDAHIEGNIFFDVRQDAVRDSSSNPISTGADGGNTSELVIARNIFVNCEHSLLLKDAGSALMQNNTILGVHPNPLGSQPPAVINFCEVNRGVPGGRGALFEGNIVWDLEAEPWINFSNAVMFLEVSHSLIQGNDWPGIGNLTADPMFVDVTNLTPDNVLAGLSLQGGSPALGVGPNGLDMGAIVPTGVSLSGEPSFATTNTSALITVAGPGVYAYKWKLNDGAWSGEVALTNSLMIVPGMFDGAEPIRLEGMASGNYRLSVLAKNSAGYWQDESEAAVRTWTVLPSDGGAGFVEVSGTLGADTTWGPEYGEVRVTGPLEVPSGVKLTIAPGTQVRISSGVAMTVSGGALEVQGTLESPVELLPSVEGATWGPLQVAGAGSWIRLRHVDFGWAQLLLGEGVDAELADCYLHDNTGSAILRATHALILRMKRCRVDEYYEVLSQVTPTEVEGCLFENVHGDGFDIDGGVAGSYIRSCTFRHGAVTNVDGVDLGNYSDGTTSDGVIVENCLIYDFPFDKGVSIGERALNIIVRDCVIHGVDAGVAVKDSSYADVYNNTVVASNHGLRLYEKNAGQGGGHAVLWNNILWANGSPITIDSLSEVTVSYSDIEGGYSGGLNLGVDPLFRNAGLADYRLAVDSPVRGMGEGGADMGARMPVGSSLVDTDVDGMPDPWELWADLDPNDSGDAEADTDGDGMSNLAEFQSGTSPTDSGSVLALNGFIPGTAPGYVELEFEALAGRGYAVEFKAAAEGSGWETLVTLPVSEVDYVFATRLFTTTGGSGFYRVVVTSW